MARTSWAAFISYQKKDKRLARRLHACLENASLRTWMDVDNLQVGDQLTDSIKQAIADSSCVVVVLTENSNRSAWVQKEVEFASGLQKPVFLLSIRNTEPAAWFPDDLRDQVRVDGGVSLILSAQRQIIQRVYQIDRGTIPVVSMLNMKGGVGKTTLAYHLFGCLHQDLKVSTLLIDLDPQHNLSQLMVPVSRMDAAWDVGKSILSVFEPRYLDGLTHGDLTTIDHRGAVPNIDAIITPLRPAKLRPLRLDIALGHFEIVKMSLGQNALEQEALAANLKRFIEQARRSYNLVVIDLNPGASFLTEAALKVSTHILAPVRPDRYSKRGLTLLDRLMEGAYRLDRVPDRLALVNAYKRSGNQAVIDAETEIIGEIREMWPTLKSQLGESDLLRARPRPVRADEDLTYWMAHQSWHNGGAIRRELLSAARELSEELGV